MSKTEFAADSNQIISPLVKAMALSLNVKYALASELLPGSRRVKVLAFWADFQWQTPFEYDLDGSPCETVVGAEPKWYGCDIQRRFSQDKDLEKLNIQFYLGVPLYDSVNQPLGHICILDDRPVEFHDSMKEAMKEYAEIFSAELMRLREQENARSLNTRITSLIQNLHDGVLIEDEQRRIVQINQDYCELFRLGHSPDQLIGRESSRFVESLDVHFADGDSFHLRTLELLKDRSHIESEEWTLNNGRVVQRDCIPIFDSGAFYGFIWRYKDATRLKSTERELAIARDQEFDIGSRIQKTLLLGKEPQGIPALNVSAMSIPSRRIDGDFYDFFHVDEKRLDVLVGDVMGKGVPAALLGAAVKSHFQRAMRKLLAAQPGRWPEPSETIARVHHSMTQQLIELESFITLVFMRFDVKKREIVFVDCGHPPVLRFKRSDQSIELIRGENLPIGVLENEQFKQKTISFEPGDRFLLYSDGLTEARSPGGELFGIERLQAYMMKHWRLEPNSFIQGLKMEIERFTLSKRFADDLTCVVVHSVDEAEAPPMRKDAIQLDSSFTELSRSREFVDRFCRASDDFDEAAIQALTLAVNEAAANVVQHAYQEADGQEWSLEMEDYLDRWAVNITHHGSPFNPDHAEEPMFDGSKSSGFGVYIILNSVDEAHYDLLDEGGQRIRLIKRRRAKKETP